MSDASAVRSRRVRIGPDIVVPTLFHPDGLRHRARALAAWYGVPFAYQAKAITDRPAAVGTTGDRGYDVKLTTGGLTGPETTQRGLV